MKKFICILLTVFLLACSSVEEDRVTIPDTVLSEEKMAGVLVDIHLLEASLNMSLYRRDEVTMNQKIQPNSDILKKHGITRKQYDESFEFYSKNPTLLVEVYQLVLNDLSKLQAESMNGKNEAKTMDGKNEIKSLNPKNEIKMIDSGTETKSIRGRINRGKIIRPSSE